MRVARTTTTSFLFVSLVAAASLGSQGCACAFLVKGKTTKHHTTSPLQSPRTSSSSSSVQQSSSASLVISDGSFDDSNQQQQQQPAISNGGSQEPKSSSSNPVLKVWSNYLRLLETKPVRTKALTASFISGLGTVFSQFVTAVLLSEPFRLDVSGIVTFALVGLVFMGPYTHAVYEQYWKLGTYLEQKFNFSKDKQVYAQVFVDQTVGACFFFPIYFFTAELMEALVVRRAPVFMTAYNNLVSQFIPILLTNWKIWPLANYINFKFVPASLRVLYNSILGVFWNAYLCTRVAA